MNLKQLLLANKEFIEVLASVVSLIAGTALGAMAIILSRNSNKISNAQLRLAGEQARPRIRLVWREKSNNVGEPVHELEVWNDGSGISNLWIYQRSFLVLSKEGEDGVRFLPVWYLFDRHYTGQSTGLMLTLSTTASPPTFYRAFNAAKRLRELEQELKVFLGTLSSIQIRVMIDISYTDILGKSVSHIYEAATGNQFQTGPSSTTILSKSAEDIVIRQSLLPFATSINELTADKVREIWPYLQDLSQIIDPTTIVYTNHTSQKKGHVIYYPETLRNPR